MVGNKFMKKLILIVTVSSLLCSGCSFLRYQYGDRSRIEQDNSSSQVQIIDGHTGKVMTTGSATPTDLPAPEGEPLITERNMTKTPSGEQTRESVQNKTAPQSQKSALDLAAVKLSDSMIAESYSSIPQGSLVYVEKVACDPPLKYNTDTLTASIESRYATSGKYKMASPESIKALRSKLEYQDVANGDWGSLAALARGQKYDYVFYGAIGEQNSKKYLTYYIIKVSSGEIVWENTRLF